MRRRKFINISVKTSVSLAVMSGVSFKIPYDFSDDELLGKGDPKLLGEGIGLRESAFEAFSDMKKAALDDGIDIEVVSGYRSFNRQKEIWEQKFKKFTRAGLSEQQAVDKIIEYSTIPGTSRHHWGTDIDIVDANQKVSGDRLLANLFEKGGPYEKLKLWLDDYSETFGFYLVYNDHPKRKGFKYEPWHYSFCPLSVKMLTAYRKLNIRKILLEMKLSGYSSFSNGFIQNYIHNNILDINPRLL